MYILATIHCMSEVQRMVNVWVDHQGSIALLTHFNNDSTVLRMAIYAVNNSLSDAVVVWRCIVVWHRDWRACTLPILLLAATTGECLSLIGREWEIPVSLQFSV